MITTFAQRRAHIRARADFLGDHAKIMAAKLKAGQPLLFMPNAIQDDHIYEGDVAQYRPHLFGILPCGTNVTVVLEGVLPDFVIVLRAGETQADIRGVLTKARIQVVRYEELELLPFKEFSVTPNKCLRLYFNDLFSRRKALEALPAYETCGDDCKKMGDYYFPKMAREYLFKTSDWNRVSDYRLSSEKGRPLLRVDVGKFKRLTKADRAKYSPELRELLEKDRTMVTVWDIETYSPGGLGKIPRPGSDYEIFTIGSCYGFHTDMRPVFTVACALYEIPAEGTDPTPIDLTIVCDTEEQMIQAHFEVVEAMSPNIFATFNGASFDWPLILDKCEKYRMLEWLKDKLSHRPLKKYGAFKDTPEQIRRWTFCEEQMKVNNTMTKLPVVAKIPGIIDTDTMVLFTKMYPKMESHTSKSLNWFLRENKLELKEDMDYLTMFRIYERAKAFKRIPAGCHCTVETSPGPQKTPAAPKCLCGTYDKLLDQANPRPDTGVVPGASTLCCNCEKRPQNLRDLRRIAYYCVIDCVRPYELFVKKTLLADRRELANRAYVSLYNAFYRADGEKVRNFMAKSAYHAGIAVSMKYTDNHDKIEFPGGFVFAPNRGLHSDRIRKLMRDNEHAHERPISGLDFASLYPSIMMTYNISVERVISDPVIADTLIAAGYTLHKLGPIDYTKNGNPAQVSGWSVRHSGIWGKNRRVIERYDKYVKYEDVAVDPVVAKVVYLESAGPSDDIRGAIAAMAKPKRTVYYEPVYGREGLPCESMGLFPSILKKLFDSRVPIKREFVTLEKAIEQMEAEGRVPDPDIVFRKNKVNSKQGAIKILANTFYGESGNSKSPLYKLLVAAGVTSMGQRNIKMVYKYVTGRGFRVHYGDTDSLYVSPGDAVFAEADAKYNAAVEALRAKYEGVDEANEPQTPREQEYKAERIAAREKYWTEQVEITMKEMNRLQEDMSDWLLGDNHTRFLNMAYEEVGYPTMLCGKKKYFLTKHVEHINFYPKAKDLMVKGIDSVKTGKIKLMKQYADEFMVEALSITNEADPIDLVDKYLVKFHQTSHIAKNFAAFAKYNPAKNNVKVQTFVRRMCARYRDYALIDPAVADLYEPPTAGSKFEFVIVEKPQWGLNGNKLQVQIGDQMEYLAVYEHSQSGPNPMKLDYEYYLSRSIVGLFARFIAYHERFLPADADFTTAEGYEKIDEYSFKKAKKYLMDKWDAISGRRDTGKVYKQVWKNATAELVQGISGSNFQSINRYAGAYNKEIIVAHANAEALRRSKRPRGLDFARWILRGHTKQSQGAIIRAACKLYEGIIQTKLNIFNRMGGLVIGKILAEYDRLQPVIAEYSLSFSQLITAARARETATARSTEANAFLPLIDPNLAEDFAGIAEEFNGIERLIDELAMIFAARDEIIWNSDDISRAYQRITGNTLVPPDLD
jgi:DNA polymerase elongation subunit (family B)